MTANNPNEKFSDLLADLERLASSPRPKRKITVMMKSSKPKRSVTVLLKKSEPLAKATTQPRFVWKGRSPKINLSPGVVIDGWQP